MKNEDDEHCEVCSAYEDLEFILSQGVPLKEAFHDVFTNLAYELIEDITEIGYSRGFSGGFDEGYKSSLKNIVDTSKMTLDMLEEEGFDDNSLSLPENEDDLESYFKLIKTEESISDENLYYNDKEVEFVNGSDFADWLKKRL